MVFIESVGMCTTNGDGSRGNDGGGPHPAGPKIKGVSGEKGGEMVGGRNVLAHGGFMVINCIVTGPRV